MSAETETSLLEFLGEKCSHIEFGDLDAHGRGMVTAAIVDTLGVMLAGSRAPSVEILLSSGIGDAPGSCLVMGRAIRTSAMDAALLNGTAAHALDYDDGNRKLGGHPSAVMIPAILALGQELGSSPREIAVAYAAGFEAMCRIADAVNPNHYELGWHPTSTLGVFGAAAASARLLQLDPQRTTVALATAASMASGLKANFGTMVKALHVGHAARDGILCARLAAGGLSASRDALAGTHGFLDLYTQRRDVEAFFADRDLLRANHRINTIKAYPCCQSTHTAVTASIRVHSQLGVSAAAKIAGVRVIVDRNRIPHTNRPAISDALEGKFSMQYVVARALLDGRVGLEHFEGAAHQDPRVSALMRTVELQAAPPGGVVNSFAADVEVRTASGRVLRESADLPTITSMADLPTGLWPKFIDCAGRVLPDEEARRLADVVAVFTHSDDLGTLMDRLKVGDVAS